MSEREVLTRARGLLERHGHAQHAYRKLDGRMCAQGAILEALGYLGSDGRSCIPGSPTEGGGPVVRAANLALAAQLPEAPFSGYPASARLDGQWSEAVDRIVAFNNAGGRTKDEVLEVFDAAVAALPS